MNFKILSFAIIFISIDLMAMDKFSTENKNTYLTAPNTPSKKRHVSRFSTNEHAFKKPCIAEKYTRFMPEGVKEKSHKVFDDKDIMQVYVNAPSDNSSDVVMPKLWVKSKEFDGQEIKIHNQAALRSCGWSCVSMVLLNHGIVDYSLAFRNELGKALDREKILNKHGITTELDIALGELGIDVAKEVHGTASAFIENKDIVEHMREKLKVYPCALVSITNKHISGHCILVYAVQEDGIVVCDPFHGWLIKVKKEAFLHEINGPDAEDEGKDSQTILWVTGKLKK